jgi:hypothetical protein
MSNRRHGRHFHRVYRLLTRQHACVYCGVRATCVDHFVPLSVVAMIADCLTQISGKVLVPACGECNSIASDRVFLTIAVKRRYIHARLRRKHRRLLAMPAWTDVELGELDYALQDFVRAGVERQRWLLARLGWRNTSNSEPVKLAALRSPFGVAGRGSAARTASSVGTTKPAGGSSPHSDLVAPRPDGV